MKSNRYLMMALGLSLLSAETLAKPSQSPDAALIEQGRQIYQEGLLPSGKPMKGLRQGGMEVEGKAAACIQCHRASGMGSLEGGIAVPPVTGRFLFANGKEEERPVALLDMRAAKNITRAHEPYSEDSLAQAITKGVTIRGTAMSQLMPRYSLAEPEVRAINAYLRQLSAELSPGVTQNAIRFATVITPGVDPKKRQVMLDMMKNAFFQHNASQQNISGRMRMPLDLIPRSHRQWELAVWELKGEPQSWAKQLAEFYRHEPVFAVVSGLSETTWQPVHAFCEQEKLPCVLPSVTLPPPQEGRYSLYFSEGLNLEADVLAQYLSSPGEKAPKRLVQVYREGEPSQSAAQETQKRLAGSAIKVENRIIKGEPQAFLEQVLAGLSEQDAVMFWLKPADLAALKQAKPKAGKVLLSGFLAGEEAKSFPAEWASMVHVVYPYEIGKKQDENVAGLKNWLKNWSLPLVDEAFQTEVFFDLLFVTDLSSQMLDNLYRDYLIERAEDMLSWGANLTLYPRLSLAPGQRYASKGAYIAKFQNGKLTPETDWIIP